MSGETLAALDDAVRAHLAAVHEDGVTVGWVLSAEVLLLDDDMAATGERMAHYEHPEGQSIVQTVGLVTMLANRLRRVADE